MSDEPTAEALSKLIGEVSFAGMSQADMDRKLIYVEGRPYTLREFLRRLKPHTYQLLPPGSPVPPIAWV